MKRDSSSVNEIETAALDYKPDSVLGGFKPHAYNARQADSW